MDEPMRITRPGEADAAADSASSSDAEWRAGLDELISNLEQDLSSALNRVREQATEAIRAIEQRGAQLFAALDDERSALDAERTAEQSAREQRVAELQQDIEAVESELRDARAEAEREAEVTREAARRRADAIIAEAEARADAIVAEARERAGGVSAAMSGAAVGGRSGDAQGRLRGLSDRVGRLLSPQAPESAAASSAHTERETHTRSTPVPGTPAHVSVPPRQPISPATQPVYRDAQAAPSADTEGEEGAHEPEQHERPYMAAERAASPPVMPAPSATAASSSSWFRDDQTQDTADEPAADEAVTRQTPVAPLWTAPNVFHTAEEDEVEAEAEAEVEDVEPTQLHEAHEAESEHAEEAAAAAAAEPSPEPVAGPGGTVTQTLIFQAVPNFQAALALERSLKAMSEVREVRVADFDERQL
ncbi:MAG: hypothetical protein AB7K36_29460, partial [Chloroflexota bacterium]